MFSIIISFFFLKWIIIGFAWAIKLEKVVFIIELKNIIFFWIIFDYKPLWNIENNLWKKNICIKKEKIKNIAMHSKVYHMINKILNIDWQIKNLP